MWKRKGERGKTEEQDECDRCWGNEEEQDVRRGMGIVMGEGGALADEWSRGEMEAEKERSRLG